MGNGISSIFLLDQFKNQDRRVYYSHAEVAKHNHAQPLWVISDGKVYDITRFYNLDSHPGGNLTLCCRAGGMIDCKKDYKFHSKKARRLWNKYLIGYIK